MIRMSDIDEFLPEMRTFCPQVPAPLAHRFIREAARQFCRTTRIWRSQDTITVTTPAAEGLLTIADAEIFEIERADFGDQRLEAVTVHHLDTDRPNWRNEVLDDDAVGSPTFITQLYPDTVTVVPKKTGTITAYFILIPARKALTLPEILLSQHAETIGRGAAAKALETPGQEYTNPQLALKLDADFMAKMGTEKVLAAKNVTRGKLRTRGSYF
ncbi:hypothetical protein [Oricola sp.]|uniref:phage adaptor protein n=1 Tax=Oricola sp. TaxID=1979950 RepID=UPI003BAB2BD5